VIDGNEVYDCDPAPSEALTLNGNVDGFQVTNNVVHDVNTIGIDAIGGERDIQPDQNLGEGGLATPALPVAQSPDVTIQLRGGEACWETVLPAPATRSDGSRFKDTAR